MDKYKIISNEEAIQLVGDYNLNPVFIEFYPEYRGSYSTYQLPDGNYMVVSSNFRKVYPAIIFYDLELFEEAVKTQKFPIPESDMIFLEANQDKIINYRDNNLFFQEYLKSELNYNGSFLNVNDFKNIFELLNEFVKDPRKEEQKKDGVVASFVMLFLSKASLNNRFIIDFRDYYGVFNRYYVPVLKRTNIVSGGLRFHFEKVLPIEHAWVSLSQGTKGNQFDDFCLTIGVTLE